MPNFTVGQVVILVKAKVAKAFREDRRYLIEAVNSDYLSGRGLANGMRGDVYPDTVDLEETERYVAAGSPDSPWPPKEPPKPLFGVGVLTVSGEVNCDVGEYLQRHGLADWGDVSPSRWQANNLALVLGGPIISEYELEDGHMLVIQTYEDRSETTVQLEAEL